jgi:sec-independent protein translocase protein TatA
MPNIGPMELIVVLAIALIILGPKKLPEAGRSVGKGLRELKGALSGEDERETPAVTAAAAPAPAPVEERETVKAA